MTEYNPSSSSDLLRLTASELQALLQNGELTSVELIKQVLVQVESHNENGLGLKVMLSVAPMKLLLETASRLDAERSEGHIRAFCMAYPSSSRLA
jgi:amidase